MPIHSFDILLDCLADTKRRPRIAAVCPYDESTQTALLRALERRIADLVLVGDAAHIASLNTLQTYGDRVCLYPATTADEAAAAAVRLVRQGEADILMKGLLNTDTLLHAILDKELGLLPRGRVLTHVSVAELPGWRRLLFFSDVAVIPQPTLDQRRAIIDYGVTVCRTFGIEQPRVALLHYSEKVNEKCPLTLDYRELVRRAEAGEWGNTIVDGPIDLRCALDETSERVKGIDSPLGGRADFLHFPDLEAGNLFYKTLPFLCGARVAGMLAGTLCPVVLSSRSDNADDKFLSLAVALFVASHQHT